MLIAKEHKRGRTRERCATEQGAGSSVRVDAKVENSSEERLDPLPGCTPVRFRFGGEDARVGARDCKASESRFY